MNSYQSITISLDFLLPPKLTISACFTANTVESIENLEDCINECLRYDTENHIVYLFPIYREVAELHDLKFEVKYNKIFSIRRYLYSGIIKLADYIKARGSDNYKINMKVKYDGF